jgi:hypothetical protein
MSMRGMPQAKNGGRFRHAFVPVYALMAMALT